MPINPIHLQSDPHASTGIADLVDALSSGFNAGFSPHEKIEGLKGKVTDREKTQLANALTKEFGRREHEADIGYKNAQTGHANALTQHQNYENAFPGHGLYTGLAQEFASAQDLGKNLGENHPIYKKVMEGLENKVKQVEILNNYRQGLTSTGQSGEGMYAKPTSASVTGNQKIIQAIDNAVPIIDELIENSGPGQLVGKYLHPNEQASYKGKTATLTDSLVGALGLPKTNESIHLVEKITSATPYESQASYKKRLEALKEELLARRNRGAESLGKGIKLNETIKSKPTENNDPLGLGL